MKPLTWLVWSLIWVLTGGLMAIQDGDPISLGTYKTIKSAVLGEERIVLVHLPPGYEGEQNDRYPVLYMLYGNHTTTYFAETVSALDNLGEDGQIPKMILIAISNTDRYRDLLPGESGESDAGIDAFVRFFSDELFPWVEGTFRTAPYRLIVGPQAGANFVFYTLFKNPELFNSAIVENPFRWQRGRDKMISQAQAFIEGHKQFQRFLYVSCNDNDELERQGVAYMKTFENFVLQNRPQLFTMKVDYTEGWDEFLAPFPVRQGLKTIFKNFLFPQNLQVEKLSDILSYYDALSREYGYDIKIPELTLTGLYDSLLSTKPETARAILDHLLQVNPRSVNALWRRADALVKIGDLDEAIRSLERMLTLMEGDVGMVRRRIDQPKDRRNKEEKKPLEEKKD